MPDTPDDPAGGWLARVPEWARGALVPDGDGDGGPALNASLERGGDDWLYWCPDEERIMAHGSFTPQQLRELADMMEPPAARDALGWAVIEAAREWFAADMDTDAQAGDRLGAAVRAYEAASGDAQRTEGEHDAIRQG